MKPARSNQEPIARSVTTGVRVTYRDTDRMGYVYYANYLVWMEMGRTDLLRQYGRSYREWEDVHGVFIPVSSCWIDYRSPALYDEVVEIHTSIVALTRASVEFEYQVIRTSDSTLLAEGGTKHPFVNREGRIIRITSEMLPLLKA